MHKAASAALAAILIAPAAVAADWRIAAQSDRAVSFIDLGSITKDGDNAHFSRWMVLAHPMASGADNVRDDFDVNCADRHYALRKVEFFKQDHSVGRLPGSAGDRAEPGTVLYSVSSIACGTARPDGGSVADPYAAGLARLGAKQPG